MVVIPIEAIPIPKAAIPYSHKGVLNTLSVPYLAFNPRVALNTPPNFTSSPKITAVLSFSKTIFKALFIAVSKFIFSFTAL